MSGYEHPEVLVDTQWVADHQNTPNIRVIESAFNSQDYDSGHMSGALAWTWTEDFQHPVRKDVPDRAGWEALLSRSGITNETTVILYGGPRNWYGTFAFWLLKIYGHSDVRLMNGGREKWIAENRPMTTEVPTMTRTRYRATEPDWSIRALRDHVQESISNPNRVLVDVREPEEYAGQLMPAWKLPQERGQRGGHIPGAVNIPWHTALNEDGTFKSAEELKAMLIGKGVIPDKEIVAYCVIGGRSNQTWFVLKYLLGYPRVRLYDGSWLEWGSLIAAPIEK
jgi:thiosulfate/3-mercaptopyruvate sulfurtransferase